MHIGSRKPQNCCGDAKSLTEDQVFGSFKGDGRIDRSKHSFKHIGFGNRRHVLVRAFGVTFQERDAASVIESSKSNTLG